jgi:predicted dehydrogenase
METLGIGMLGYGFMGKTHTFAHKTIPFYYDPPPVRTELKIVCRTTDEGATQAQRSAGFERSTTNPLDVIEADDVDVIHICTPNREHLPALVAAMRARKHIYCEKPVTANLAEADSVADLLPSYRGKAQVVLQYRFFPATLRAKQLVDEGFLGPVTHFHAAYLHSGSVDPTRAVNWKSTAAAGGGVIRDLGPHIVDMMQHLVGPFQSICCTSRIWSPKRPSADTPGKTVTIDAEEAASMLLRTSDGAFGTVEVSKIATGTEDELRFEIHGQYGAIRFNLMQPNYLEVYDARPADGDLGGDRGWQRIPTVHKYPAPGGRFPSPKATVGWTRGHVHCLYSFLKSIADETDPQPSLADGLHLQRVLEAAITSSENRTWLDLPPPSS